MNDTEIIAILSSEFHYAFSYDRILLVLLSFHFCFIDGFLVVPAASEGFNNFRYKYVLEEAVKQAMRGDNTDVYRQISDNEFILCSFNTESKTV
jgi:lipopolysaccharide export system permease protein